MSRTLKNPPVVDCSMDFLIRQTEFAMSMLEKYETQEYFEAIAYVPALVEIETPVALYLKALHNNSLEAARRIARYWKYRKSVFSERWLLPMTLTGSGALQDMEIEVVKSGVAHGIPRKNTGPLIIVDFTKFAHISNRTIERMRLCAIKTMERVGMYVATRFMEELARGPSTLMHPITSKSRPALEVHKRWWEIFQTAFPATLSETVVAQSYEEGKEELLDFLRFQSASVMEMATGITPKHFHANSTHNTLRLLEQNGISRDVVPVSIGGQFDYDVRVADWVRMRLCVESLFSPPASIQIVAPSIATASLPTNVMETFGKPISGVLVKRKPQAGQSEEEFLQERNRVYVRRFAQKQRFKVLSLENQVSQLQAQKGSLLCYNEKLEHLVASAMKLVESYEALYSGG